LSIGGATADVNVRTTAWVTVDSGAVMNALYDVRLTSTTNPQAITKTDTNGGGLVASADANASATVTYDSQVFIGSGAHITAGNELNAQARSDLKADANADANAAGLGGHSGAGASIEIGNATTPARTLTFIGQDAQLQARTVNLSATVGAGGFHARADAESDSYAAFADSNANATVHVHDIGEV